VIVCCEVGGYVFASLLALQAAVPLALIRKTGKRPPPYVSVTKATSHNSKYQEEEESIAMERDAVAQGTNLVVVDDVLATGQTLCAVLEPMQKAGVAAQDISVMVVTCCFIATT
jgi:adenine/guanine phosphoribosyltransferase-like PRPP-binding protein